MSSNLRRAAARQQRDRRLDLSDAELRARRRRMVHRIDLVGHRMTDEFRAHAAFASRAAARTDTASSRASTARPMRRIATASPRVHRRAHVVQRYDAAALQATLEQQIEDVEVDADENIGRSFAAKAASQMRESRASSSRKALQRLDETVDRERSIGASGSSPAASIDCAADTPKARRRARAREARASTPRPTGLRTARRRGCRSLEHVIQSPLCSRRARMMPQRELGDAAHEHRAPRDADRRAARARPALPSR